MAGAEQLFEPPADWKSVRHGKVQWNKENVAAMAMLMWSSLPRQAKAMIAKKTMCYTDLVILSDPDGCTRPTYKDIAVNYVWLRPLCEKWPDRIPSGFFLADTFLMMDSFMGNLLLMGPDPEIELAREEARRVTRLLGALRYLWRNGDGSHDHRVAELKQLLKPSPSALARRASDRSQDASNDGSADEEDDDASSVHSANDDDVVMESPEKGESLVFSRSDDTTAGESPMMSEQEESDSGDHADSETLELPGNSPEHGCKRQRSEDSEPQTEDESVADSDADKTYREALATVRARSYREKFPLPPKSLKSAPAPKPECFHAVDERLENAEPPLVGLQAKPAAKASGSKSKAKKSKRNKKASFRRGSKKAKKVKKTLAKEIPGLQLDEQGYPKEYRGYSLEELPFAARPQPDRVHRGMHSYTVKTHVRDNENKMHEVLIDILLAKRAYYVKKCCDNGSLGQVSWKKAGNPHVVWPWPLTKPGVESTKCPLEWVMQSKAVISSSFCFEWILAGLRALKAPAETRKRLRRFLSLHPCPSREIVEPWVRAYLKSSDRGGLDCIAEKFFDYDAFEKMWNVGGQDCEKQILKEVGEALHQKGDIACMRLHYYLLCSAFSVFTKGSLPDAVRQYPRGIEVAGAVGGEFSSVPCSCCGLPTFSWCEGCYKRVDLNLGESYGGLCNPCGAEKKVCDACSWAGVSWEAGNEAYQQQSRHEKGMIITGTDGKPVNPVRIQMDVLCEALCFVRGRTAEARWACKWMELLDEAKVPRGPGKPLLPSPAEGGGWSSTPISAEASSAWLRSLLITAGQPSEVVLKYGSHSCKSTVLSWLAKHGTEPHVRAILGYHVSKAGGTELVYGRDNLSAPLRTMEDIISQVAQSTFDPDATRSGMFVKGGSATATDDPVESDSSSCEDSADEEDPQHILAEHAADSIVGGGTVMCMRMRCEAVFKSRAKAAGLADGVIKKLIDKDVKTFAILAFVSEYNPGAASEKPLIDAFEEILGRKAEVVEKSSFRRLFHEAYALANLIDFLKFQAWTSKIIKARIDAPPPGFDRPSVKQLMNADAKLFEEIADRTRSGVQATAAGRPIDAIIDVVMHLPDVCSLMQPLPHSRVDPPTKLRDDRSDVSPNVMAACVAAGDGQLVAPSNSGVLAEDEPVSTMSGSSMGSVGGDVTQSKGLEKRDAGDTPDVSKSDGIPLRKALVIELCAGSAKLSSACAKVGFTALAVDFSGNKHSALHHVVYLDLRLAESWQLLQRLVSQHSVIWVHIAPPCGTASRARERPLRGNYWGPKPLRSSDSPWGLNNLSGKDRAKVDSANAIYKHAEYPRLLCDRLAQIWLELALEMGFQQLDQLDDVSGKLRADIAARVQPRRAIPPLIREFARVMEVQVPGGVVQLDAKLCLVNAFGGVPAGSKRLKTTVKRVGDSSDTAVFMLFGVYYKEDEFLNIARSLDRPFDVFCDVPDCTLRLLHFMMTSGPVALMKYRLEVVEKWRGWLRLLLGKERELHWSLEEDVESVVSKKNILLMEKVASSFDWQDQNIINDICDGFNLVGTPEPSGVFVTEPNLPTMSVSQLDGLRDVLKQTLWSKIEKGEHCEKTWDATVLEAKEKGWLVGPLSWSEVEKKFSGDWTPVRRFGIQQSGKLRVIDDFSENATNGAQEKIDLKTLEHVARCTITLADFLWHSDSVSVRLSDGTLLEGALHSGWSRGKGAKVVSKTVDLKSAYKQYAISPTSRKRAVVSLKSPADGKAYGFVCKVLPFGASVAVVAFNRISRLLWRILTEAGIVCSAYFDDFPIIDHSDTADGASSTIRAVLAMLGVACSEDKDVGFSESTQMLGVVLETSSASKGFVEIRNKPDRVEALVAAIDSVLQVGMIRKSEVPRLFGRLQFAEHQIFGRVGMLAMADLRELEKSASVFWKLDDTAISAFRNLRWRLKQSVPRTLRVKDGEKPLIIFTDGACEFSDDGRYEATVGGILYSSDGTSECFGGKVDGGLVSSWRSDKDHVIGLVELYAVVLARSHWRSLIGGRKWDTSLVSRPQHTSADVAVSSRDYHALLFTARVDLAGDQTLKLPWETGVLKTIFDEDADSVPLPSQVLSVSGDMIGALKEDDGASNSLELKEKTLSWMSRDLTLPVHACAIKVLPDRDFFQELEILWEHAIDKWLTVFEILGYPGLLGELLLFESQRPEGGRTRPIIRDAMGIKSPRTAIKRSLAVLKYFKWLQANKDVWDPWSPSSCIDYMSVGNAKGPVPSKGLSLLEAFRFCRFVLSIPVPEQLLENPLVKGRASRLGAEKVDYNPARSLKASEVSVLERQMLTDMDVVDKYMLGAVLFCIFSRSRWSDLRYIDQFWVEKDFYEGEVFGFIEARTKQHKSATSVVKKQRFMPLVCPILGITGVQWVDSWTQSCEQLGVVLSRQPLGPLCRAAASGGGLCERSVTTSEISIFINAVLSTTDPASSHSLKHTTLEWASAYGIDEDARKLLGHHSLSGDKALSVYSRDLLNRPLQLYCSMLRNIRLDHFRPDESRTSQLIASMNIRAGLHKMDAAEDKQQSASEHGEEVGSETSQPSAPREVQRVSASEDDGSSTSSSSDSEESKEAERHDYEKHDWIAGPVWRNRRSKVVHKLSRVDRDTLTACGRAVDVARFEHLQAGCSTLFARCGICFRGEVITCVDGLATALQSASAKRARTST
eukprot:symbB.v1.2.014264.t1/scaffold1033.1/size247163/2